MRHATRVLAIEALAVFRQHRRSAVHVQVYVCSFCGGFHLGHPRRKKRTRRAEFGK